MTICKHSGIEFESKTTDMQWISVQDHLPEAGETVLIYIPANAELDRIEIAWIQHQDILNRGGTYWFYPENNGWTEDEVTHWMSLPEKPKG